MTVALSIVKGEWEKIDLIKCVRIFWWIDVWQLQIAQKSGIDWPILLKWAGSGDQLIWNERELAGTRWFELNESWYSLIWAERELVTRYFIWADIAENQILSYQTYVWELYFSWYMQLSSWGLK
jgi:hypothetical protein